MKQGVSENLTTYVRRFTKAALDLPGTSDDLKINSFIQGLSNKELFRSLALERPKSFDGVLKRVRKYIMLEEAQVSMEREVSEIAKERIKPLSKEDRK